MAAAIPTPLHCIWLEVSLTWYTCTSISLHAPLALKGQYVHTHTPAVPHPPALKTWRRRSSEPSVACLPCALPAATDENSGTLSKQEVLSSQ